jgi:ubiquinone/menaquinone biosynthesis C-methylase UbiE
MPEHEDVYRNEADRYHALVSSEDYAGNLADSLQSIIPAGDTVLETGSGTGRVTAMLTPLASELACFDLSVPMLEKAEKSTPPLKSGFMGYASADHRSLPVPSNRFDWIVSGWSVCYLVTWNHDSWLVEVNNALREFARVLHPEGHILLIETLGTGETIPNPPGQLTDYLDYLAKLGFQRRWIRTDYRFVDEATARDLTSFFFGESMLKTIQSGPAPTLPECTGVWTISRADLLKNLPG